MQSPRLRTVYRQRKWPLLAPVRNIIALGRQRMALECKIIALVWNEYYCSVECLAHGLHGCNDAVQRRLATLTVTMLISSCWQLLSEVELQRIFDVCKRWAKSGSHEFINKNTVQYMRPHGRFAHCSCKNTARAHGRGRQAEVEGKLHFHTRSKPTARFGLLYRNILFLHWYFKKM